MPVAITSSTGRGSEIWVSSVAIVWYFLAPRDAGCAVGAVPALPQRDPAVVEQGGGGDAPAGHQVAAGGEQAVRRVQGAVRCHPADQPADPHRPAADLHPDGVAVLVVEPGRHLGGAVPAGLPRPETAPVVVDPFPGCRRRQAGQLHRTGHSSSLIWNSCRPNIEFSTSAARIGNRVRLAIRAALVLNSMFGRQL